MEKHYASDTKQDILTSLCSFPSLPSLTINFWAWADYLAKIKHALQDVRDLRTSGNCCYQSPPFLWPRDQKKRRLWGPECFVTCLLRMLKNELTGLVPRSTTLLIAVCRRFKTAGCKGSFRCFLPIVTWGTFGKALEWRVNCDCILKADGATRVCRGEWLWNAANFKGLNNRPAADVELHPGDHVTKSKP